MRYYGVLAETIGPLIIIALAIPFAVSGVRVNKSIQLSIEAASTEAATSELTSMCNKLLANTVIENFHISLTS